jgi:hypothetical protein
MQSLDITRPGMPDLQFVLMVAALCTSDLPTLNVPEDLRRTVFDRLTWEHPPSEPTRSSTPEALPLIERLQQLFPNSPDDPQSPRKK